MSDNYRPLPFSKFTDPIMAEMPNDIFKEVFHMIMETNECIFHFVRREDLNLLPDEHIIMCKMFNGCYEVLHVSTRDDFINQYERFRYSISDSLWIRENSESKKTDTIPDAPLIFYDKFDVTKYDEWFGTYYSIINDDIELVAHIEGPILEALLYYQF